MCGRERGVEAAAVGWFAIAFLGLVPACGDLGPPPPAPLESALSCGTGWQTLPSAVGESSPLAYHDGVLYYWSYSDQALQSLRVSDGAIATLAEGVVQDLWVEGDQIMFTGGDQATLIYSVSATGGTPRLVVDATTGRAYAGNDSLHAADAAAFYWTEDPVDFSRPTTVWRASRSDGIPVQIGAVTPIDPVDTPPLPLAFRAMGLTGDAVLLGSDQGVSDAVPFDGGPARLLATTAELSRPLNGVLAGIDLAGVYWTVRRAGVAPEDGESSLILAPADGGPMQTFWEGTPPHAAVVGIWPTGDGGWVLAIRQQFDDQMYHVVISMLEADGTSQRLACSPAGPDLFVQSRPVVAADAVYIVADGNSSQTEIVRIAR